MYPFLTYDVMKFNNPGEKRYYYSTAAQRFVERSEFNNPELRTGRLIHAPELDHEAIRREYAARLDARVRPGEGEAPRLVEGRALWYAEDDLTTGHDNFRTFEQKRMRELAESWCRENDLPFHRGEV